MKSIRDLYKVGKGPSSSHTMGPERAARIFKQENPGAERYEVTLYGSLALTGVGHGTDRVLSEVLAPTPTEIIFSKKDPGDLRHPNTLDFAAYKGEEKLASMRVESIGGKYHYSDLRMAHALGVAGIIGNLIRRNASISGAECGCQAEIGSACSMAAAAMCELMEFPIEQIEYAAEIAMEHHLGLTCDPICGLVQIPCIERNAVAAKRAIDSANLAHMLVGTRTISFDMVVRTMYETGVSMNRAFRETSEGGLAKLYSRRAGQTLGK